MPKQLVSDQIAADAGAPETESERILRAVETALGATFGGLASGALPDAAAAAHHFIRTIERDGFTIARTSP